MSRKAIVLIVLLIIAGGLFFANRDLMVSKFSMLKSDIAKIEDPSLEMIKQDLQNTVLTPAPLRSDTDAKNARLTVAGIVEQTNIHRSTEGLKALKPIEALNRGAEIKLEDMFDRQYFAHEAPTGEGPADIAVKAGYAYIIIGENLALGNFKDDKELVQGWMDSPGHRANIMNDVYTEIGVAVGRGMFEGKMTWLAVQEFGLPAAACPAPDAALASSIDANKAEISRQDTAIAAKKREVENYEPKSGEGYNAEVREYNDLVDRYNALVQRTKALVEDYNRRVGEYNSCLKKAGT